VKFQLLLQMVISKWPIGAGPMEGDNSL